MKTTIVTLWYLFVFSGFLFGQSDVINPGSSWHAEDALGRKLPTYDEVGGIREGKYVGLFYWSWHTDHIGNWVPSPEEKIMNLTDIFNEYPEAENNADHPVWQDEWGGVFWWDEPLFGYYRTTDRWVLRKHAEMLADAGVDVIFLDNSNANWTWKSSYTELLNVWDQARNDGVNTPDVCFHLPFSESDGSQDQLLELYDELYASGNYDHMLFKWDGKPLIMAYPESLTVGRYSAGQRFTASSAFYGINARCPSYGNNIGSLIFALYEWKGSYEQTINSSPLAEELFENFSDNERLALEFDELSGGDYLWELREGTEDVGVYKFENSSSSAISYYNSEMVEGNYDSEIAYLPGNYEVLATGSEPTPVKIRRVCTQEKKNTIQNYFTFRPSKADYVEAPSGNQWGWLEKYPQHRFVDNGEGGYEQVPVGVAINATDNQWPAAFNQPGSYGRSYTNAMGHSLETDDSYYHGHFFQEQWERAKDVDPELVFVTGWNEWISGRYSPDSFWNVEPHAFVDQYSAEKSRDIEPVKSWGDKGDVYYMQLVKNIREFKGMPEPDSASSPVTININDVSDWDQVTPEFNSYRGNVMERGHYGQGDQVYYENTSGRNDIVKAKVARDNDNIWFYVETAQTLSDKFDPAWMRLLLDIDRDKSTGWQGYDFLIHYSSSSDAMLVESSQNDWNWETQGTASYSIHDNVLIVQVDKTLLGINDDPGLDFEFKWSDNMQEDGNIMDFYVNGDVAPGGRFNYRYLADSGTSIVKYSGELEECSVFFDSHTHTLHVDIGHLSHADISVFDMSGRKLFSQKLNKKNIQINMNSSGFLELYLVKVSHNNNNIIFKILTP